jgi:hypothetical protein
MLDEAIKCGMLYPPVACEAALAERLLPEGVSARERDIAQRRSEANRLAALAASMHQAADVDAAVLNYAKVVQSQWADR